MNSSTAFCPQCKQDVVFAVHGNTKTCPACGYQSRSEEPPSLPGMLRSRGGWLIFFAALFTPALLTFIVLATGATLDSGAGIAFIGSGMSAIVCGTFCALRSARSLAGRILLGILLFATFYGVCFALCFAGCTAASAFRSTPLFGGLNL
jgi:ribosomal protein S27AE